MELACLFSNKVSNLLPSPPPFWNRIWTPVQMDWTLSHSPFLETIILFLGKQFRAEMHKKYHDCQSSSLIDKRIKFYFLVISRLRMLTPRELDQAQLLPRCYAFIHHEETERTGHLAALPLHFPLSSLSSNSRPILHL